MKIYKGRKTGLTSGKYIIAKFLDFGAALPLVILYALGIYKTFPDISLKTHDLLVSFDIASMTIYLSQIATFVFMGLMIFLFIGRRLPVTRVQGWRPLLAALVGSNMPFLFLALPRVHLSATLLIVSNIQTAIGLMASIVVAGFLGRSFGILPQARKLVLGGPYRIVRHPLYLAEQIATFGIMWQFAQPWSFLVAIGCFLAQLPRMHYEEKILARTYSNYEAYKTRTARIIPGIY